MVTKPMYYWNWSEGLMWEALWRQQVFGTWGREQAALSPVPLTPELCVGTETVTSSFS